MTFSICVREPHVDADGDDQHRFGVAVTTRPPDVGALCPFATEHGAVVTQALTNVGLGRKGMDYLEGGLAVDGALQALPNADDGRAERQLHGAGSEATFTFTSDNCLGWAGHHEGDACTVAGNLLTGEAVVDATADAYERTAGGDEPFAKRLIDVLGSGHAAGGNKRDDLTIQSTVITVTPTEDREMEPHYNDLHVDATETSLRDLREAFSMAREGYEAAPKKYVEA